MTGETPYAVGDLTSALNERFPYAWADPWDRVGLVVGDPSRPVSGVLVTLDATGDAVARARAAGCDVLVTHHPPFLDAPEHPQVAPGPRGTLEAALRQQVAVISLHTNLDRSPAGAEALALALGLTPGAPLESGVEDISVVIAYVPPGAEEAVRAAMASAGAGRVGEYAGCAHSGAGLGHFEPLAAARPAVSPQAGGVAEQRIEMVCPRSAAACVLEAARSAHPYEEPLVLACDGVRARGVARYGRVCTWDRPATVDSLARHVASTLGTGVRVWGEAGREVTRIATANGSGSSLLAAALEAADVLVTGEVRYHDALEAVSSGLAIIEAGHDVTEWPLVGVLGGAVAEMVPGTLPVRLEEPTRAWRMTEDTDDRG